MITDGAKLWFAITFYAVVAAGVYHVATGRGDDGGVTILLTLAAATAMFGGVAVAIRDGDASAEGDDVKEAVRIRSALPAPWPALAALGVGVTIVGYSTGGPMMYVGFGIVGAAFVEWMVQAWAERSTADPEYNKALRNRIMLPIEVPALGFLGVGFVIITFSRVLLAVPSKNVSTVIAIVVASLILLVASLAATRPRVPSGALSWLLAVGAVALLAAGVISGVSGEREIEHHEAEHAEGESEGDAHVEDGNAGTNDESEGTVGDDGSHDDAEEAAE